MKIPSIRSKAGRSRKITDESLSPVVALYNKILQDLEKIFEAAIAENQHLIALKAKELQSKLICNPPNFLANQGGDQKGDQTNGKVPGQELADLASLSEEKLDLLLNQLKNSLESGEK